MSASTAVSVLLLLCEVSMIMAASSSCGQGGYPTTFLNGGQTVAVTLQYGTAMGLALSAVGYGPALRGCTPHLATTGVQAGSMYQWTIEYNSEGLVLSTTSNDTANLGQYRLAYESVPDGLDASAEFSVRPVKLWVQGLTDSGSPSTSNATFRYDTRGRLSRVDWIKATPGQFGLLKNSNNRSMRVGVGSEILAPDMQAAIAPIDGSGMGEGYQGWESYQYDDEHHPLHPSLYQSGGSVGHAALHFTYRSDNTTGKLGSVTRSPFMEASSCRPQCSSQTYCCTNAASSSSGWCSDMPCQKMGHTWAYSYVGDNAVAVEIDGMPMQHFAYSSSEALTSIEQKVSIANNTKQVKMLDIEYYKNGNVKDLLAFVAYPWVPEPWVFEN